MSKAFNRGAQYAQQSVEAKQMLDENFTNLIIDKATSISFNSTVDRNNELFHIMRVEFDKINQGEDSSTEVLIEVNGDKITVRVNGDDFENRFAFQGTKEDLRTFTEALKQNLDFPEIEGNAAVYQNTQGSNHCSMYVSGEDDVGLTVNYPNGYGFTASCHLGEAEYIAPFSVRTQELHNAMFEEAAEQGAVREYHPSSLPTSGMFHYERDYNPSHPIYSKLDSMIGDREAFPVQELTDLANHLRSQPTIDLSSEYQIVTAAVMTHPRDEVEEYIRSQSTEEPISSMEEIDGSRVNRYFEKINHLLESFQSLNTPKLNITFEPAVRADGMQVTDHGNFHLGIAFDRYNMGSLEDSLKILSDNTAETNFANAIESPETDRDDELEL